ncbi:MAG: pyridoxamine 5'-phosphate oxidase family protein [Bacillota bacterium]|nr:pyridoxamine 5'-phosphate oxidase family protein [Bacillota bacterium]
MEIVNKAADMLAECDEITLASISEAGYPRICVVSKIKSEGIRKLWAATGLNSVKVRHFNQNDKASACFYKDENSVTLIGRVSVIADPAVKAEMWIDWFIDHFQEGVEDPNYCILQFEAEEATLWIDNEFVTVGGGEL